MTLTAADIGYASASESIRIATLEITRDTSVDLRATDLVASGINADDLEDGVYFDSLSIASIGGVARVQGPSGNAPSATTPPVIRVAAVSLPEVDLTVSGGFGQVGFTGAVTSGGLEFQDSLSLESLAVDGNELTFDDRKGLSVALKNVTLDQGALHYPIRAAATGPTTLEIPEVRLTTDGRTITSGPLRYNSKTGFLTTGQLAFSGDRLDGTLQELEVININRAELLTGTPPAAEQAVVTDARLTIRKRDGGSYAVHVPEVRITGLQTDGGLKVKRAELGNAEVHGRSAEGKENLIATGIEVDQYAITSPLNAGTLGPANIRVARLVLLGDETPVDYRFDRMAYDTRGGILTIDSLNRVNRYSPDEMFRQKIGKSWMNFAFDGLRASGIDHDELVSGEGILIDSLSARDFRLKVVEDLSLDLPGKDKMMPIEGLRKIGPHIKLNAARFSSTDITYGVVDSILEPKSIHFSGGDVVLTGVDTEVSTTDSVRAIYDAVFEETTPLHAEFVLARDSSGRNYAARGELGSYDLSRVNPLMEVAADAIVETGIIDRLTYRSALQDELMKGEMDLLYHNLDLKVVGSGAWIKNLLSGVVVKNENVAGEDFRKGKIYHEHDRQKSFFNAYWKGLVSGMRSSALSDIALQKELD